MLLTGTKLAVVGVWEVGDGDGGLLYIVNSQLHGPELPQATLKRTVSTYLIMYISMQTGSDKLVFILNNIWQLEILNWG